MAQKVLGNSVAEAVARGETLPRGRGRQEMMKPCFRFLAILALGLAIEAVMSTARAASLSTAFTYQGFLATAGNPVSGSYDLRFELFDAATGGNQFEVSITKLAIEVAKGVFTTELDFRAGVFDGTAYWLEIAVREAGSEGDFEILQPRQRISAVPNALHSMSASRANSATSATTMLASGIVGVIPDNRLSTNVALLSRDAEFTGFVKAIGFRAPGGGFFSGPLEGASLSVPHAGEGRSGVRIGSEEDAGTNAFELTIALPSDTGQGAVGIVKAGQLVSYVDANGGLWGASFLQLSDGRLKTILGPVTGALEKVRALQGFAFEWKSNASQDAGRRIGLAAEEVERVLPEVVRTDQRGYRFVAYSDLVAVLVEAVKRQQDQIESDAAALQDYRLRLEAMEKRESELRARMGRLEQAVPSLSGREVPSTGQEGIDEKRSRRE